MRAQDPAATAVIQYSPSLVEIQDTFPFTRTYTFEVTSPSTLPEGSNPVWFEVIPTSTPVGVGGLVQSADFVSVSSIAAFTEPNQTRTATVTFSMPANAVGGRYTYKVLARGWAVRATNIGHFINATVTAAAQPKTPAVVEINSPLDGATFVGSTFPLTLPVNFTVKGPDPRPSAIDSVTYELDGHSSPITLTSLTGLGTTTVTGVGTMKVMTPGVHNFRVSGHNQAGTSTQLSTFRVNGPPAVEISSPTPDALYGYGVATGGRSIPFGFLATSESGNLTSVTATLNGAPITGVTIVGAASSTAYAYTPNLQGAVAGQNTLVVTATNGFGTGTATTKFYVNPVSVVVIQPSNNPTFHAVYNAITTQFSTNVDLSFSATVANGFQVDRLWYQLNNGGWTEVAVPATAGTSVTANVTLVGVPAGNHTVFVRAMSRDVTSSSSATFTVVSSGASIGGAVFFDANGNGSRDFKVTGNQPPTTDERGLDNAVVTLTSVTGGLAAQVTQTDAQGRYVFANVPGGQYRITVAPIGGLKATGIQPAAPLANGQAVEVQGSNVEALPVGFGLDLDAIQGARANGSTIGFWKNNLEKNLSGKGHAQLSSAQLDGYTLLIAGSSAPAVPGLALEPYALIDAEDAVSIMSSNSSAPLELLRKQLLASEYNYASGAYLNGSAHLTYYFIYWGEYILKNPQNFSAQEITRAKDWFDAYNNTHGGALKAPGRR